MNPKRNRQKSVLLTMITIINWLIVLAQFFLVDPELIRDLILPGAYLTFYIPLWLALFGSLYFWQNLRRSLLISTSIIFFLILRMIGYGSLVNLLLLTGIIASLEFYLSYQPK